VSAARKAVGACIAEFYGRGLSKAALACCLRISPPTLERLVASAPGVTEFTYARVAPLLDALGQAFADVAPGRRSTRTWPVRRRRTPDDGWKKRIVRSIERARS
jgi:hypothetical protein